MGPSEALSEKPAGVRMASTLAWTLAWAYFGSSLVRGIECACRDGVERAGEGSERELYYDTPSLVLISPPCLTQCPTCNQPVASASNLRAPCDDFLLAALDFSRASSKRFSKPVEQQQAWT